MKGFEHERKCVYITVKPWAHHDSLGYPHYDITVLSNSNLKCGS